MKLPFVPKSRDEFPMLFNEMGLNGTGVEIGVHVGQFFEHLRRNWNGKLLVGVDPWKGYGDYCGMTDEERYQAACKRAESSGGADRDCLLVRETSAGYASLVRKSSLGRNFDFVYLDGDHSYEGIKEDLRVWWPLVRSGGVLCGHDWVKDGWRCFGGGLDGARETEAELPKPGWPCFVRKACNEFFFPSMPQAEFYTTSPEHDGGWQSWLVVKP